MSGAASFRILVLGASGLIGSAIARQLDSDGHAVRGVARNVDTAARRWPQIAWHKADIAALTTAESWAELLQDTDMIVNASGALQDGPGDTLRALQVDATTALFDACAVHGKRVIQISAAGVETSQARFMALKHEADTYLRGCDCDWTILRPGFVLAPVAYGGSGMLRALAAMPFAIPLAFGDRQLRTVHVNDIAEAVAGVVVGEVPTRQTYDLVSSTPESFADVVTALRDWLGLRRAPLLNMSHWLVRTGFRLGDFAGMLGWKPPMRSAALAQMAQGVSGDPGPWERETGRAIANAQGNLQRMPAGAQEIWFARLWLLKPVIFVTLSLFWLMSGLIGLYAALMLSAGYLAGSVLVAPALWLDPLGPMLKVIPAIVLTLVALAILEDR